MWQNIYRWGVAVSVFLLTCCWLLIACGTPQENPEKTTQPNHADSSGNAIETFPFPEGAVAIVNGQIISEEELAQRLHKLLEQAELSDKVDEATLAALRKDALEVLIENILIDQLAHQQNIEVTEGELQQRILQVQEEYNGQDIQAIVEEQGELYDDWILAQQEALLLEKVIQIYLGSFLTVTEKDARAHYEEHHELYEHPAQIRASQILTYDKATAREALQALREGIDFAEVAGIYSESADAEQGGDLGFFAPGVMPPEFDKAILSLQIGEISDIIKTPYGYQIFMLTGQRTAQSLDFDEVQSQILTVLRQQKRIAAIDMWIAELQKNAKILLNHERIQQVK
jgi:parvulin-like peptidyl-prolyl isomerase